MSRLVGIVALVIAFGWAGFLAWRLLKPHVHHESRISLQPKPIATIETVGEDLCTLAHAEVDYQHLTGRYAAINQLQQEGRVTVPDSRWPYIYVLHLPSTGNRFLIVAVSLTPIESQPRVLQIDDQLQVQTRTHPPRVFACK